MQVGHLEKRYTAHVRLMVDVSFWRCLFQVWWLQMTLADKKSVVWMPERMAAYFE